jgi:hypothetical protein
MHHTVAAAERQAGLLAAGVAAADPWLWRLAEQDGPAIEAETIGLIMIRALQVARSLGATRVIWPAWAPTDHAGEPIVERVAAAIDAATLASRFASTLGHLGGEAAPAPRIETPLADLTDRQVADLADDFSLDFSACWWHRTGDEHPWAAAESARWHEALAAATGVRP